MLLLYITTRLTPVLVLIRHIAIGGIGLYTAVLGLLRRLSLAMSVGQIVGGEVGLRELRVLARKHTSMTLGAHLLTLIQRHGFHHRYLVARILFPFALLNRILTQTTISPAGRFGFLLVMCLQISRRFNRRVLLHRPQLSILAVVGQSLLVGRLVYIR